MNHLSTIVSAGFAAGIAFLSFAALAQEPSNSSPRVTWVDDNIHQVLVGGLTQDWDGDLTLEPPCIRSG